MILFIYRKTEYDEYSGLRKWQYRLLVTKKKWNGLTNLVPRIVSYSFVTGENPGNEVEF